MSSAPRDDAAIRRLYHVTTRFCLDPSAVLLTADLTILEAVLGRAFYRRDRGLERRTMGCITAMQRHLARQRRKAESYRDGPERAMAWELDFPRTITERRLAQLTRYEPSAAQETTFRLIAAVRRTGGPTSVGFLLRVLDALQAEPLSVRELAEILPASRSSVRSVANLLGRDPLKMVARNTNDPDKSIPDSEPIVLSPYGGVCREMLHLYALDHPMYFPTHAVSARGRRK